MFTGIVTHTGTIERRARGRIVVCAPRLVLGKLTLGGSIAVSGVCLTVIEKTNKAFSADLMEETLARTTFGEARKGSTVNLELPATPVSFLAGHIVQGHVDGVGVVKKVTQGSGGRVIEVALPKALMQYIAPKGSIALDGVSLTVISCLSGRLTVGLIPRTAHSTTLGALKPGRRINVETDILAKYVHRTAI